MDMFFIKGTKVAISISFASSSRSVVAKKFKSKFPNTRIIIDCYEVECQRPSSLLNSSTTYSQYKSRNTWKFLVACTPSGLVSFYLKLGVDKCQIEK